MELNKKNKFAENVKNKILNLQEVIEKGKRWKQFMEDYVSMKYGYIDPNPNLYYTTEQFTILDKWEQNSYFTNDEKDFIINYLIDCLVENQPFDCSSLGPNKYLNE